MATCLVFVGLGWTGDVYQPMALCVGGDRLHRRRQRRRDVAGPQDRLPGRRDAARAADRPAHRRRHRRPSSSGSTDPPARPAAAAHGVPPDRHRQVPGAAGDADGDADQGAAGPQPRLAVRDGRRGAGGRPSSCAASASLSFAVGAYLPLSTTTPRSSWAASLRAFADRGTRARRAARAAHADAELGPGNLFATGLVAGGAVAGVVVALLTGQRAAGRRRSEGCRLEHALVQVLGRGRLPAPRAGLLRRDGGRCSGARPVAAPVVDVGVGNSARLARFELATPGFVGRCSIQMSYSRCEGADTYAVASARASEGRCRMKRRVGEEGRDSNPRYSFGPYKA